MARSEYSTLRGIAMKRLGRLESAGLTLPGIHIPKSSELKTAGERSRALEGLKAFLSSPTTTVRGARSADVKIGPAARGGLPRTFTEKQAKGRQKRERQKATRKEVLSRYTAKQRGFIKGAKTLGINISTSQIPVFIEYMEYRFSQIKESEFYIFATYVEDFESAAKKDPKKVQDILNDFNRYKADRAAWMDEVSESGGYSEAEVLAMWNEYIKDF